jgi:hypothetical protein
MLPANIIADLAETKWWISTIVQPKEFQHAYDCLAAGRCSESIDRWLYVCETLSTPSMYKAYYPRTNRLMGRDDLMQHGRMAAVEIANQVHEGRHLARPMQYAWRSIKREIHLAAFGKARACECRIDGKCTFHCPCRAEFDINCDCFCQCKCHKRTVSNFTNYYGDGDYDPIDHLAGEGEALRERVEDILCHCTNQIERDVVMGIAAAIEDGKRANQIYLTLDYSRGQIIEAWKAVAAHYLKVLVSRGESLPGRPGGNQRRPPRTSSGANRAA